MKRKCEDCKIELEGNELKFCVKCRPVREGLMKDRECPRCGQNETFEVSFNGRCKLKDSGSEDMGDHEWDDDSSCVCDHCAFSDELRYFDIDAPEWLGTREARIKQIEEIPDPAQAPVFVTKAVQGMQQLCKTITYLRKLYDENPSLNDLQPPSMPHSIAGSLEDWECRAQCCLEDWRMVEKTFKE